MLNGDFLYNEVVSTGFVADVVVRTGFVAADSAAGNPAPDADLATAITYKFGAALMDEIVGVAQSKVTVGKLETFNDGSGVLATSGKADAGGQV